MNFSSMPLDDIPHMRELAGKGAALRLGIDRFAKRCLSVTSQKRTVTSWAAQPEARTAPASRQTRVAHESDFGAKTPNSLAIVVKLV
jgi:hypothetical protein